MKRIAVILGFLAMTTVLHAQAPVASAVVNAASYTFSALPNGGIAEGSMFIVFGSNMGPATLQGAPSFPLQTTLAGTSVSVTVNSTTTQAFMIYTSAGQVAAILPSSTPAGTGLLVVTFNGQSSSSLSFQVVQSNFGAFTFNQGGSGSAIILDGNSNKITPTNPAAPGQTVALWGTGLGPITSDESKPPPQDNLTNIPVTVYVGTAQATLVYRGRTGYAGVDQINFQIPPGQLGCNVSVIVQINSIVSNATTMAVSSGGPCSDANGISSSLLSQLTSSGTGTIGTIGLSRQTLQFTIPGLGTQNSVTETGSASFYRFSSSAYFQYGSAVTDVSIGGCSVITFRGSSSSSGPIPTLTSLDAGSSIGVSGPTGTMNLTKQQTGLYSALFSSPGLPGQPVTTFLGAGRYVINGPGGADVGPFQATITGVSPLNSNISSITSVNRLQNLNITWAGGPGNGYVNIEGYSTSGTGDSAVGALFFCVAPASAGQFTVPPAVLLSLPPSGQVGGVPTGFLFVGSQNVGTFSATGITQGITYYSDITGQGVAFN